MKRLGSVLLTLTLLLALFPATASAANETYYNATNAAVIAQTSLDDTWATVGSYANGVVVMNGSVTINKTMTFNCPIYLSNTKLYITGNSHVTFSGGLYTCGSGLLSVATGSSVNITNGPNNFDMGMFTVSSGTYELQSIDTKGNLLGVITLAGGGASFNNAPATVQASATGMSMKIVSGTTVLNSNYSVSDIFPVTIQSGGQLQISTSFQLTVPSGALFTNNGTINSSSSSMAYIDIDNGGLLKNNGSIGNKITVTIQNNGTLDSTNGSVSATVEKIGLGNYIPRGGHNTGGSGSSSNDNRDWGVSTNTYSVYVTPGTYTASNQSAEFVVNCPEMDFVSLVFNGKTMQRDTQYSFRYDNGLVRVTIFPAVLDALANGVYPVAFYFSSGNSSTTLTVARSFNPNQSGTTTTTAPAATETSMSYRVLASTLNVRSAASGTAPVIGKLTMNTIVVLDEIVGGNWGRLANSTGYVSMSFLVPITTGTTATGTTGTATRVTTANVNMRGGPGTSFAKYGSLPAGTSVTVIGYSGTWAQATVNGMTVYIHSAYLR